MRLSAKNKICLIIGNPVEHSLSPQMHNAAYEELGIDNQYVFIAAHVKVENLKTVVEAIRAMSIRGLTCTLPHKLEIIKYLDEIDPVAKKIGAVNTVINDNGKLVGFNTDWIGITRALKNVTDLKNKKVGLIGAGGAGRAAAHGLVEEGAEFTVFNRHKEKGKKLATEFKASDAKSLEEIKEIAKMDIIINATSVGMETEQTPCPTEYIKPNQIVYDIVYSPYETKLLRDAASKGANVIHGTEMLIHQGTAQFEHYTGRKAPEAVMRKTVHKLLGIKT